MNYEKNQKRRDYGKYFKERLDVFDKTKDEIEESISDPIENTSGAICALLAVVILGKKIAPFSVVAIIIIVNKITWRKPQGVMTSICYALLSLGENLSGDNRKISPIYFTLLTDYVKYDIIIMSIRERQLPLINI